MPITGIVVYCRFMLVVIVKEEAHEQQDGDLNGDLEVGLSSNCQ